MSRCFPYPPPGFEKKARSDQSDLSTKEKHKEKKHKKEKRGKEKKQGKERKDKDRSKDKHKEKKDRKEKYKDKKRDKDKNRTSDDRRIGERTEGHTEHRLGVSIPKAEEIKDSRYTEELGRRIRDEEKGAANRMFENGTGPIPKRVDGLGTATALEKERGNRNPMVANFPGKEQGRIDEVGRPVEKDNHNCQALSQLQVEKDAVRSIERKEKAKDGKADDGKGDRHRDREREENKNKGKDKNRDKEKEREKKKRREKGENKQKEHDRPQDSGKKDQVDSLNFKPPVLHNDEKCSGNDGHSKKRKDFEMNGFLHEDEVRPNKLPRPASSSHQRVENGRTLELGHIPTSYPSIRHGTLNNIKAERVLDNKQHKINGTAEAQPSPVELRPSLAADTRGKSEAVSKPPDPDSKYLSQICSVPKMEEWPESDDQDWLFSSSNPQPKPKAKFEAGEEPQVWATGLQIESADVFALPYVIPY